MCPPVEVAEEEAHNRKTQAPKTSRTHPVARVSACRSPQTRTLVEVEKAVREEPTAVKAASVVAGAVMVQAEEVASSAPAQIGMESRQTAQSHKSDSSDAVRQRCIRVHRTGPCSMSIARHRSTAQGR